MTEFALGCAAVITFAGAFLLAAPERAVRRVCVSPLPEPNVGALKIIRIGGAVLLLLAAVLLFQVVSE